MTTRPVTLPEKGSKEETLDDLGFLVNHTITCLVTDVLEAPIKTWWTAKRNPEKAVEQVGILESAKQIFSKGGLASWAVGEGAGDILAIPATLSIQKYAPEVMDKLRELLEPLLQKPYLYSAQKAADVWAEKHDIAIGSGEYREYAKNHYEKEMRHAPQAFVWTAMSLAIALPIQKHALPKLVDKVEDMLPWLEKNASWAYETVSETLESLGNHENQSYLNLLKDSIMGKTITYATANMSRLMFPQTTDHFEHEIHELFAPDNKLDSIDYCDKIDQSYALQTPALA